VPLNESTRRRSYVFKTTFVKELVRRQDNGAAEWIDSRILEHSEIYENLGIPKRGLES
jgi:hypothetical protein